MKSKQKRFRVFNLKHWFYIILVCLCILNSSTAFAENRIDEERQSWEVFTNRSSVNTLLLSDDEKTLWAGTEGGLEKLDAITGQLIQLFTNLNELPDNYVLSLLSDSQNGLWVGTIDGLAHLKSDGKWEVFNKENSGLQDNWVYSVSQLIG